jgi:hypothetical protein
MATRWTRAEISRLVADHNPEAIMWDGFEEAFIGMSRRCGQPTLVTYSYKKCIQVLIRRDKMTLEEAVECFEFNTVGGWLGEHTPICVEDLDE